MTKSVLLLTGDTLFIVMDLIEGAPLDEHFNSLKEKGNRFSETRIWNILIQVNTRDFFYNFRHQSFFQ